MYKKIRMQLLAAALLVLPGCAALAQGTVSDAAERAALLALRDSTSLPGGAKLWPVTRINAYPNPDSTLAGVRVANGDIVEIDPGKPLTGKVPRALNHLHALNRLNINGPITGQFPLLDSLIHLDTLVITNHDLTGVFPPWIGKLTELQVLDLYGRPLGTRITGPIPASISQLTSLQRLSLTYCNFNQAGAIPSLANLDQITGLIIIDCHLVPQSFQSGISGMASLRDLDLSTNDGLKTGADNVFPEILYDLPNLEALTLRGCGLDKFPASLALLGNLQQVNLSNSNFSSQARLSSVIDILKICPRLNTLMLDNCQIVGLPDDFDELNIKNLYMSVNNLNFAQCEELGTMPHLEFLKVESSGLSGLPASLSNATALRTLLASGNAGLSTLPEVIKNIPNLDILELNNCGISSLPLWFGTGAMDTLRQLSLNNNTLVTLPANFGGMKNLKNLQIVNNDLDGTWPASFTAMKEVTYLALSNNDIDSLPDLSSWSALEQVYLDVNKLSGAVPAFLSRATSPKTVVNIANNGYSSIDPASYFNTPPTTVIMGSNQFTFEDVVAFRPTGAYVYWPQPEVDVEKEIYAYSGGRLTLRTTIDTQVAAPAPCLYQWFLYVDGVNDQALNSPSATAEDFTGSTIMTPAYDGRKFYYKITNSILNGLVLKSKLQTLVISCKDMVKDVSFTAQRYLCAMAFMPTVHYVGNCQSVSFAWDFGDNTTSNERTAWHAYANDGTYTVKMKLRYTCGRGACQSDTVLTQQVTYTEAQMTQVWQDVTVIVPTHKQNEVINVSAATFSDSWPMHDTGHLLDGDSYSTGQAGVWRNDATHVYDVPRSTSPEVNLAKDGTFTLEYFNWQLAEIEAIPNWIRANQITQYSPYSYELENRDVLGIYSAALYDYGGHLPSANGVNMRNNEMAYSGFEFIEGNVSGNLVLGNAPIQGYALYTVRPSTDHIAVVEAPPAKLEGVTQVDVSAQQQYILGLRRHRYIQNDPVVCMQPHDGNPDWSVIVLKRAPFDGLWRGQIKVTSPVLPGFVPVKDTVAHTGKYGLKITTAATFEQPLLKLDSGKAYVINLWVSVNNPHTNTPVPLGNLGVDVSFRDSHHNDVAAALYFQPAGPVVEGWQQVRGRFVVPDDDLVLTLRLRNGPGTAWYDDLRIHPEKANMKSYVYNLTDYRVSAILDEENFSSRYFYDREGNLFLVKKETERGIKTISENVSYQTEYKPAND